MCILGEEAGPQRVKRFPGGHTASEQLGLSPGPELGSPLASLPPGGIVHPTVPMSKLAQEVERASAGAELRSPVW